MDSSSNILVAEKNVNDLYFLISNKNDICLIETPPTQHPYDNAFLFRIRFKNHRDFGLSIRCSSWHYEIAFLECGEIIYPKKFGYDDVKRIYDSSEVVKECENLYKLLNDNIMMKKKGSYYSYSPYDIYFIENKPIPILLDALQKEFQKDDDDDDLFRMIENNSKILLKFKANPYICIKIEIKRNSTYDFNLVRIDNRNVLHLIKCNFKKKEYTFLNNNSDEVIDKNKLFEKIKLALGIFKVKKVYLTSFL